MTKMKKIIIPVIAAVLVLTLSVYLAIGFFYDVRGTNGFGYMHAVIGILLSGKDAIKVNDSFFVYKKGELVNIIKSKFDVLKDVDGIGGYKQLDIDSFQEDDLSHLPIVEKDGIEYRMEVQTVLGGIFRNKYYKVYFTPHFQD
ncbi:MAG: hypothetical protein IJ408_04855 [Clostridia bacterium]|nr:hypothetical protein [Clostridia bacterium]